MTTVSPRNEALQTEQAEKYQSRHKSEYKLPGWQMTYKYHNK